MSLDKALREKRGLILALAAKHGARDIRVFGSAVRGESGPASDIDLLVDMEEGRTFLDLVAFWQDLEELLGCPVDLLTVGGINPYIEERIYSEALPL